MKWTTLLSTLSLVLASFAGYGQITLREKNAPLEKVLADIEKQTKYIFLYNPDAVKMSNITIGVKNASLQTTLGICFKGLPIEYTLVGNSVLLKSKEPERADHPAAAEANLQGRVIDENGQPLAGVTVIDQRKKKATATDTSGAFHIPVRRGDGLRFSFVGYKEKEIVIGEQTAIVVALELNPASPEQVVVIGYGTSKRKDLTGSIAVVDLKNMEEIPFNTVDNALAGRAAGVEVTKSDGTPGGTARVRIRGSSSLLGGADPLYVVDGIPLQVRSHFISPGFALVSPLANLATPAGFGVNSAALSASYVNGLNSLGGLDPDDIESITVLKDASSTAIYGSKAGNGVVIITTKTGKTNELPRIGLNYYTTVTSPVKPPALLNATQYRALLTEAALNASMDTAGGFQGYNPLTAAVLDPVHFFGTANTDWIKQVTRTTVATNAGISVAGGGPYSKYFASLGYTSAPGVVKGTNYQRLSGRFNGETKISSKIRLSTHLLFGSVNQNISDGVYGQALLARPDLAPRETSGSYTNFDLYPGMYSWTGLVNPLALTTATNSARTLTGLGSLSGSYAISNGLVFRSTASLNLLQYNQRNYVPRYIDINGSYGNTINPGGIGSDASSRFTDWFLENTLSYDRRFNEKQALNVVIGQSYETTKYSFFRATAAGYPNDNFLNGLSSADTVLSVAGDDPRSPQSYLLSFYARANYSYRDKYLFTFSGRTDGSSKFGPDNKFGYFPSGAIAWRLSKENVLKDIRWIDDIKLRGSYGLTGNQNIGDQLYRSLYSPSTYAGSNALTPTQLGNEGIKWESTREGDIGLDLAFFTGRLTATADYYNRQTNGGLLSLQAPSSSGYNALLQNAVGLRNRGFELSVGGELIHTRDLKWTASLNVSWNSSRVTRLDTLADLSQIAAPSGLELVGSNFASTSASLIGNIVLIPGMPLGLLEGHVITGIIKTQSQLVAYRQQLGVNVAYAPPLQIGDPMYKLAFDPGQTTDGYPPGNEIIGTGPPSYFGGMTQELSYKRLGLQCYFTFSKGGHLLWAEQSASTSFHGTANGNVSMLDSYTPENSSSDRPRLNLNATAYTPTNLDVFSSSYFKLRSLTLNYHFGPDGWMKKTGMNNLQVFVSATNIFTITRYPGNDPETSDDPYSVAGGYIDTGNYPATRTVSFGLKAAF